MVSHKVDQLATILPTIFLHVQDVNVVVADGDAFDDENDIYHGGGDGDAIVADGDGDV